MAAEDYDDSCRLLSSGGGGGEGFRQAGRREEKSKGGQEKDRNRGIDQKVEIRRRVYTQHDARQQRAKILWE
jgi:hypothetical protein